MKAVITLGYIDYVMPLEQATVIINALMTAELYARKGYSGDTRHYVYPNDDDYRNQEFSMKLISDDLYRVAKLAGKPKDDN